MTWCEACDRQDVPISRDTAAAMEIHRAAHAPLREITSAFTPAMTALIQACTQIQKALKEDQ